MDDMRIKYNIKAMKKYAFKMGFFKGFSVPFLFFSPEEIKRPVQFNGSVEKAWSDVGSALFDAMILQGEYIEQKIEEKRRQHKIKKSR